jgi:D-hexose-6-phosphate mutarotase
MKDLESQNLRLNSHNEEMTKKCDLMQLELERKCSELTEHKNENQQNILSVVFHTPDYFSVNCLPDQLYLISGHKFPY